MKKKSKNRIPSLKRKLWEVVRQYIYARDQDEDGLWTCFTCDRRCEGANRHAGHFIPDAACPPSLRYDERNLHVQCYHCNINLGGWGERYTERMENRYGKPLVKELRKMQTRVEKWDWTEYEVKIQDFTDRLEKILNSK